MQSDSQGSSLLLKQTFLVVDRNQEYFGFNKFLIETSEKILVLTNF